MSDDIFAREQRIRKEADEILYGRGLHAILSDYGDVFVCGSYCLELMVPRDLDIVIGTVDTSRKRFFEMGGRIAEALDPVKMLFLDNIRYRTLIPVGLHWDTYVRMPCGEWTVDLWVRDPKAVEDRRKTSEGILTRLTPALRKRILQIKEYGVEQHGPARGQHFAGWDVYGAVLDNGVETPEQFLAYLDRKRKGS